MSGLPSEPAPAPVKNALTLRFPPELPISARVADISAALSEHQVVIVAGATGSGKTTQLPKIALSLGRGSERLIGITQPRRIAATSVATRVASELQCSLGSVVGYQIRFEDRSSKETRLKFMTDGILLAEIQGDKFLRRYDTLIIDEAHERSLTIDFLLGWLKRILPERPDLKVIVSSATIETARFSEFFGNAPVIAVEGRTYPVDVLYEPPEPELDLAEAVANAVVNVTSLDPKGDILVFLPGEREIRETEQELARRELRLTTVQPLYARLSAAEQNRVFARISGRRVILATNVAETSLTIPGIVYVIDSGVARLSRYDPSTGTTRLQIEGISQASADQRKGRCGRVRDGICVRLYDEVGFATRPEFTDPEIKRTGLAGVILRMKFLRLGEIEEFPFLDAPPGRSISEGYRVLEELGAIDEKRDLTPLGQRLARLPVDPRIGRMIVAGAEQGCLDDVLVLAAALGLQDPRERPRGAEHKAEELQRQFKDASSDFVGLLKLWAFVREAQSRGTSQLRRTCKENYLSFLRVREWGEVHRQLQEAVRELRIDDGPRGGRPKAPAGANKGKAPAKPQPEQQEQPQQGQQRPHQGQQRRDGGHGHGHGHGHGQKQQKPGQTDASDALHRALLSGLLSRIGQYNPEQRNYVGARQTRFAIHPSSALSKKPPAWLMAFELVQTTQLFARTVAKIEPEWLDQVAGHLLKRSYSDPHWAEKAARARIKVHATLFGLPVLRDYRVDYSSVAPVRARLMFLEHALVRGEYESRGAFAAANRALLAEVARLRDKARQSGMLADDDALLGFFERRVPDSIMDGKSFESWRQIAEQKDPSVLRLSIADVLAGEPLLPEAYPDVLKLHGVELPLSYRFEPGADDDGVTVSLPLALLPQLDPGELDWTIPAWQRDKIVALLESLPKGLRQQLGKATELADLIAGELEPFSGPLLPALAQVLRRATGVDLDERAFRTDAIQGYLRFTFRVLGEQGEVVAQSRDLAELLHAHGARGSAMAKRASSPAEWERTRLSSWDFDELPEFITRLVQGTRLRSYPAIVDRQSHVDLSLLESVAAADSATRDGVRRLLALGARSPLEALGKRIPPPFPRKSRMPASRAESEGFRELVLARVVRDAFGVSEDSALPRTRAAFDAVFRGGLPRIEACFDSLARAIGAASAELDKLERALDAVATQPSGTLAAKDIRAQLEKLCPPELIRSLEVERLEQYPRYFRAAQARLTRAIHDPRKDADKLAPLAPVWSAFLAKQPGARDQKAANAVRWGFEELRVAIFAPELKPAHSVSLASLSLSVSSLR